MKSRNKLIASFLLVALLLLAAMGCCFCWHCPSRLYAPESHGLFWRQLIWNGIGLTAFCAAWLAGWKRLLKVAPWLMLVWLLACVAAQFGYPVNGSHRWLRLGYVDINVRTLFLPVFALFVAWLHDRKWLRTWMEWAAIAVALVALVGFVATNESLIERLKAYVDPGRWMMDRAYMARQLQLAFDEARWFGDAGRSLGFLPCAENDGMMSASALMFGKWFPVAVVALFSFICALLTLVICGTDDKAKRRYALMFGLWLVFPAAYCFLHSLALMPVVGMSPALASYGGTAVLTAWFGVGVLAAMLSGEDVGTEGLRTARRVCVIWCGSVVLSVVAVVIAPGRETWVPHSHLKFAEPRPSDMEFGEFGLMAKRGSILAADCSELACSERGWRFYLDPCIAASPSVYDKEHFTEIAEGLGIPVATLLEGYARTDSNDLFLLCCEAAHELGVPMQPLFEANSRKGAVTQHLPRHIFLKEVPDGDAAVEYFDHKRNWLTKQAGIMKEPIQKRVYPLGEAAAAVVGFMHGGAHTDAPQGAGGLEWCCDRTLAGMHGVYDLDLPLKERMERAKPKPGEDVRTTLDPETQKIVFDAIASAGSANGAESAWGIVMEIPSGEISAMASWPSFDPSMSRSLDVWSSSLAVNRAARSLFEPGDLIKPVVGAIALDGGSAVLDKERLHEGLRRFGFGAKTCAEGMEGEEVGIFAGSAELWNNGAEDCVAIGFGIAVTGLQIVQAYATLANHGAKVTPRVLATVSSADDDDQVVSTDAADAAVRSIRDGVMISKVRMVENGVYSQTSHVMSCVGLFPCENPQYVIAVSFVKPDHVRSCEEVARPVLVAIADAL